MSEYSEQFELIKTAALILQSVDLAKVQATISNAHSVGPIVDPTAYRSGMDNLRQQQEAVDAAAPLKAWGAKMLSESTDK